MINNYDNSANCRLNDYVSFHSTVIFKYVNYPKVHNIVHKMWTKKQLKYVFFIQVSSSRTSSCLCKLERALSRAKESHTLYFCGVGDSSLLSSYLKAQQAQPT